MIRLFTCCIPVCIALTLGACHSLPNSTSILQSSNSTPHTTPTSLQQRSDLFLYMAARNAIQDNNPQLAIRFLETLVLQQSDITPHLLLAELYLQTRQAEKALQQAQNMIGAASSPTIIPAEKLDAWMIKARALILQHKIDTGMQILDTIQQQHSTFMPARILNIRILHQQKRDTEALQRIEEAIAIQDQAPLRELQSDIFIQQDNLAQALKTLRTLQILAPDHEMPIIKQATILMHQQKLYEAEQLLRAQLPNYQSNLGIRRLLAQILVQTRQLDEAVRLYQSMLQVTGDHEEVLSALGIISYSNQDYAKAEEYFRRATKLTSNLANTFYLAASLEALNHNPEALALYKTFENQAEHQMYGEAILRLARLEMLQQDFQAADKHLASVIYQQPSAMAYALQTDLRLALGQHQQLLDESTQAAESDEWLSVRLLFNRAIAYEALKQYGQLDTTLKRLLSIEPEHAEALNFLGYSYAVQGILLDDAKALITKALAQDPDNGYYIDSLAWVYFRQHETKQAITLQLRAISIIQDDPIMHEHLGDMFWHDGQAARAQDAWKKSLKLGHSEPNTIQQKIAHGLPTP